LPEVLMISKPVVPPFDDSAKNVVLSQARYAERYTCRLLTAKDAPLSLPNVRSAPIYETAGAYSPGLMQNLKVMLYGLRPRGADIYHYFFAPNKVTSFAGRLQKLAARVKSVQTVCSQPKSFENIRPLLFADRIIVLSSQTKERMLDAGVEENRLVHIRPGIDFIEKKSDEARFAIRRKYGIPEKDPMVLFPGDYEFSSAARTVADAVPILAKTHPKAKVVFACRIKRPPSVAIRDEIRDSLARLNLLGNVVFLERVEDMPAFVGAADVAIMPAESLYAKMDVPLVLLEAASQQVPLILANVPPLSELLPFGVGLGVPPSNAEALADAVGRILDNSEDARQMGEAGEHIVQEIFSAKKAAAAVERVYDEVMDK
jgi:glycosyltransferase involved in cell wall biosynthesis